GKIRLPTGAITACDPLSFLDSARCFARQVEPGEYAIEVGKLEEGGQIAYALIRFNDALIESWDVALIADRDRPRTTRGRRPSRPTRRNSLRPCRTSRQGMSCPSTTPKVSSSPSRRAGVRGPTRASGPSTEPERRSAS
ncbi:MAG: DUF4241 domain-containing protein, partial [Deltaproteobacteria bacterium]|nr:DUF4241 domain-containing protein [Deltaproteobacteria bacterium]